MLGRGDVCAGDGQAAGVVDQHRQQMSLDKSECSIRMLGSNPGRGTRLVNGYETNQ